MEELNSRLKREGNSRFSNSTTSTVVHHKQGNMEYGDIYD